MNSGRRGERSRIDERARAVLAGFDLLGGNQPRSLINKYAPASRGERANGSRVTHGNSGLRHD